MRRVRWLTAFALLLLGAPAGAVSLGEINVQSTLNQPLRAEIPVSGISENLKSGMRASIASPAAFERAGLRRESLYDDVTVELISDAGDNGRITLKSKKRVGEPFLSFLVELRWSGGSVLREYTVLLDPATYRPPATVAQAVESGDYPSASRVPARRSSGARSSRRSGGSAGGRSYGPISPQETLWSIASGLRPDPSITMDQMQLAIFKANPQAFDGNIHRMRKGSTLRVPSEQAISAINPASAKAEIRRQAAVARGEVTYAAAPRRATPRRAPRVASEPDYAPAPPEVEMAPPTAEIAQAPVETLPPTGEATPAADPGPSNPPPALAPDSAAAPAAPATDTAANAQTPPGAATPAQAAATPGSAPGGVDVDPEESATAAPTTTPPAGQALETPTISADGSSQQGTAAPAPQAATPAPAPAPVADSGDSLALVKPLLFLVLVAAAGLVGVRYYRKRKAREEAEAEAAVAHLPDFAPDDIEAPAPAASAGIWQNDHDIEEIAPPVAKPTAARAPAIDLDALFATPAATTRTASGAGTTAQMTAANIPVRDTDYIGEAELHIAYGLYDEAAAVLERGVQENPQRNDLWVKLLDVYAEAKNSDDFVAAAERFKQNGRPTDSEWQKITSQAAAVAPEITLSGAAVSTKTQSPVVKTSAIQTASVPKTPAPAKATANEVVEFDLSQFDAPAPAPAPKPVKSVTPVPAVVPVASKTESVDIDLSGFDLGTKPQSPAAAETPRSAPAATSKDEAALADSLDFNLDSTPGAAGGGQVAGTPGFESLSADFASGAVEDEESGVKLDLARAYLDMGEADMARGLLEEVAKAGSAQQRTEAQDLLARV